MQRISNWRQTEEVIHWQSFKNCGSIEPMQVHVNDLRRSTFHECAFRPRSLQKCKIRTLRPVHKLSVEGWTLHTRDQRSVGGSGAVSFLSAT